VERVIQGLGWRSIARKDTTMQKFPLSKAERKPDESRAEVTSEHSRKPGIGDTLPGLKHSSPATIQSVPTVKSLTKTSKGLDYPALRLQLSLITGYLGMFKKIKGARVKSETVKLTQPDGNQYMAIRIFLAIDLTNLSVVEKEDEIEFSVGEVVE
jgi:hypothetical protein